MITVHTKQEFEKALANHEHTILCKGEIAEIIKRKHNRKKRATLASVALIAGGLLAIPFTGGASSAGIIAGTVGLTVGTITISTAELAILCGTAVAIVGIASGARVKFNSDGSVTVEPQYK